MDNTLGLNDRLEKVVLSKEDESRIQGILKNTDWGQYWADVGEASRSEIDAYRIARVKSLSFSGHRVLL